MAIGVFGVVVGCPFDANYRIYLLHVRVSTSIAGLVTEDDRTELSSFDIAIHG